LLWPLSLGVCRRLKRPRTFDLDEATIPELQHRMETGQDTARSLVEQYLARIDALDRQGPSLRSVLEINPDTRDCGQLDAEQRAARAARTVFRSSSKTTSTRPIG
jgi:Asp-tRNA(Asn)/Glu-tRNA(Gln) amidotransferase A subunit family amidase